MPHIDLCDHDGVAVYGKVRGAVEALWTALLVPDLPFAYRPVISVGGAEVEGAVLHGGA